MVTQRAHSSGLGTRGRAQRLHRAAMTRFREFKPAHLDIGLINNMPDAALDATERQFRALLSAAADHLAVHLTLYTLPEVPRTDFGRRQVSHYSALGDLWTRRFPDPVAAFASGWMRVRARGRQRGIALPLVISDHADWDGLTATITATGAAEVWVTHGQEDALVHFSQTHGLKARPLALVGYGEEDEADGAPERGDAP